MTAPRQTISTDDLKSRLLGQIDHLVAQFAPEGPGSYHKGPLYFTLNPGRADRSVGSFCIHMSGPKAGRWVDYAVPGPEGHGDVIDLIGLSLGISEAKARFKAAREWLGLDTESPETRRAREDQAARLRAARESKARDQAQTAQKMRKLATATWLSAQEKIISTPVDLYLQARGIQLSGLPHQPGAIRYHPECRYYWHELTEVMDEDTGEMIQRRVSRHRPLPAMLTAIARGREIVDCHRTYLALRDDGTWGKAPVEDAKKVFTDYTGGSARLCGELGPRGGHLTLRQAPAGARVFVTEGIENALSLIALRAHAGQPPAFVVAAGSLWNMAHVELPPEVTEVVLAADNDGHDQAREGLAKAVGFHQGRGRQVRIWRSPVPGTDLNDALKRALNEGVAA